jgi:hypothetical protein
MCGLERVTTCVALAVSEFNFGTLKTSDNAFTALGVYMGNYSEQLAKDIDKERLRKSDISVEAKAVRRREMRQQARPAATDNDPDDIQYQAGAF